MNAKVKSAAHVVYGLDKDQKPRAALIHPNDLAIATKAAIVQGFKIGRADTRQALDMAKRLPDAKVFATGKGLVPLVRRDIFDWLAKGLTTVETKPEPSEAKTEPDPTVNGAAAAPTPSSTTKDQPASKDPPGKLDSRIWDQLTIGMVVIAPEKNPSDNGYWPAVITAISKDGQKLTFKWRDAPKLPAVTVKRRAVALLLDHG